MLATQIGAAELARLVADGSHVWKGYACSRFLPVVPPRREVGVRLFRRVAQMTVCDTWDWSEIPSELF